MNEKKPEIKTVQIEVKDPITLGFQLACGPFVAIIVAGLLLFLAFLVFDMSGPPSF